MLVSVMNTSDMIKVDASAISQSTKSDRPPLAEIKNGKVVLKQKPISFEKTTETMQEIVSFRRLLEERMQKQMAPLGDVPAEHLPLIAKLVHESDKTLSALAKHIHNSVLPAQIDATFQADHLASALTLDAVERAINSIAQRTNYGLDGLEKVPAALRAWRWEVNIQHRDWLPRAGRDAAETRIAERQQAKKDLHAAYYALSSDERDKLMKTSKKDKVKNDENGAESTALPTDKQDPSQDRNEQEGEEIMEKSPSRPKKEKSVDPEKTAKEKEKAEKRAAKAERERKEAEAKKKSSMIMSAFFAKPKAAGHASRTPSISGSIPAPVASSSQTDFERTFKEFVVKKDSSIAPINWFADQKKAKEVIVLDRDENTMVESHDAEKAVRLSDISTEALLKSAMARTTPSTRRLRAWRREPPKSEYCVRTLMAELSEAEVVGDTTAVRHYLDLLQSRAAVPVKVFIFHDDTRPGYFGTFTKKSTSVKSRKPLARDPVALDYSYDSGAEWEEEEEGGDDLMSLDGSADEEDGSESELDDWLVDDAAVEDPGTPLSERAGSPDFPPLPAPKRKLPSGECKDTKKRKVVVPLVPFTKGPCWEVALGKPAYDPFKPYCIRLFNDTPSPIDPFTFVSTSAEERVASTSKSVFAVPALPARVANSTPQGTAPPSLVVTAQPGAAMIPDVPPKRKTATVPPPKTTFPDIHVPHLINKINSLATGNLTGIVESIYQDLKNHKVKKNAIEAKVREIGEKCKFKKVWIVKGSTLPTTIS
ncbi:hypothetical protein BD410DRAFT_740732 [Rickenella mellea]|uniref:Chromatin assembly factor 1 subunit A dimerization domain-containing protein n=1 Tax=Rickenella mellea TaxID=50990 RepID=A0A4Y7QIV4_9AGAM|nr:hypothetical protein BD410DRAFT_740732 [Rickenella mellea]